MAFASSSKNTKLRFEPPSADEIVSGFVHFVSPVKLSSNSNTQYFQCILQSDSNTYDDVVSFTPEKRAVFLQASEKKTPVKLVDVAKTLNCRSPSGTSIQCRKRTLIQNTELKYKHKIPRQNHLSKHTKDIKLDEMGNQVIGNYVNVTAKIQHLYAKRHVYTKAGETNVSDAILADSTGSVKVSIWSEKVNEVQEGRTYLFQCLAVKEFLDEHFLSTCADTTFVLTDDIPDVHTDENFTSAELVGTPVVVKIKTTKVCNNCKSKMDLQPFHQQKKSTKCEACGMRQLVSSIKATSSAKMKMESHPNMLEIPDVVLKSFAETHDINDEDDIEEFLLEHKLTICLPTKKSTVVSAMKTSD